MANAGDRRGSVSSAAPSSAFLALPQLIDQNRRPIRIDSPTLEEAMFEEGVDLKSLMIKDKKAFRKEGKQRVLPEISEKRFAAYEAIRLENTNLVLEARQRLIDRAEHKAEFAERHGNDYGSALGKEGLGIGASVAERLMKEAQQEAERILQIAQANIEKDKARDKEFEEHVQETYRKAVLGQLAREKEEAEIQKKLEKTRFDLERARAERAEKAAAEEARLVEEAKAFSIKAEAKDKELKEQLAQRKKDIQKKRMAFNRKAIKRKQEISKVRAEEEKHRVALDRARAAKLEEVERVRVELASEQYAARMAVAAAERAENDARKSAIQEKEKELQVGGARCVAPRAGRRANPTPFAAAGGPDGGAGGEGQERREAAAGPRAGPPRRAGEASARGFRAVTPPPLPPHFR
jgi:hypothetical protein